MGAPSEQDWELVQRVLTNDLAAFEALFHQYKVKVLNLAYRFTQNQALAEEITQEVFLKIYEKKIRVNAKTKFSTWLYRVTVNASLDTLRKKKNAPASLPAQAENIPDPRSPQSEQMESAERNILLQTAIDALPEQLRTPLLLYQFEEMSYADIAHILGISKKAVERRLAHAKADLRKQLAPYFLSFQTR